MEVVVTGIGVVSGLGLSWQENWRQLLAGKSAIKLHHPFPELKPLPLALVEQQPSNLGSLIHRVIAAGLSDAGLVSPLPSCGVVLGSSRSQQQAWEQLGRQREFSNTNWIETLPSMGAVAAARQIGVAMAPVLAPMASCATGIWAIAQGYELIQTGQCQQVVAGAVEAPITPLTLTGFSQMRALSQTGAYPFDLFRTGLVLGEGAAVLVLESAASAKQRAAKVYGHILGFGFTADGYHPNQPEPKARSAITAVKQCLERSQLLPNDINYIHAHGTATVLNDHHEMQLIQHLFPQGVPVSSTKGATGHTLGASGALGVAFSLLALEQQLLPPCVGLKQPEWQLDFVITPRPSLVQHTLCFSFGFGGQNAVIALGKAISN